jgi:hypothetical protein
MTYPELICLSYGHDWYRVATSDTCEPAAYEGTTLCRRCGVALPRPDEDLYARLEGRKPTASDEK